MKEITIETVYEAVQEFSRQTDKRFAQQFAYFDSKFKAIDERFDILPTLEQYKSMQNSLDQAIARLDTHETEIAALNSQTRRHETWIQKIVAVAKKYYKL